MGCTGSQEIDGFTNILNTDSKPEVWLIGGGPGSEKGRICEYIIRDYKFKYLSSYDMVQFQQERGGPDAELISKLFKQQKTMPSDLIVRLVKKAIASCGIRKFLIDGFPNSVEDVVQFEKQLTSRQIKFYGYIHITISQDKMIKSGIEANSTEKSKTKAEIQANVRQIVKLYSIQSKKIQEIYLKRNLFLQINGQEGADKSYQQIRDYLYNMKIKPPNPVKVFFSHFDDPQYQLQICDDLIRKYGLYFYTPKTLIQEAANKPHSQQGQTIRKLFKQSKQVPPSIVLGLIRKKIEKHDFRGCFLISGYPRTVSDAKEWDKIFGWETDILGYLTFQIADEQFRKIFKEKMLKAKPTEKEDEITKQFDKYQANQKQITNFYKQRQKILVIDGLNQKKALEQIQAFFAIKGLKPRLRINLKKVVLVNNLCGNGQVLEEVAKKKAATYINMEFLLQSKIKENGLYSQLIQSYIKIGKPIPGIVACRILFQELSQPSTSNLVIINGFPNSEQQLLSWQEEVGQSISVSLLMIYSQNHRYIEQQIKQKIKKGKLTGNEKDMLEYSKENSNRMSQRLKQSDWNIYTINSLDNAQSIQATLNKNGFNL